MNNLGNLFFGLTAMSLGIFVLCYTYKYLKMGKMRAASVYGWEVYSFKKQPKEAYKTMLINCLIGVLGIIIGVWYLLDYFHILIYKVGVIKMDKLTTLGVSLTSISLSIFTIYHTYKYLKNGKSSIYSCIIYSFKRQLKQAYLNILINCLIAILSIIIGFWFLLIYIQQR